MSGYDIYIFCLCFIVFSIFTVLFTYMIWQIMKMESTLIQHGHMDTQITKEYQNEQKYGRVLDWITKGVSLILCVVFGIMFLFSLWMKLNDDRPANGIPSIKVVKSDSMSYQHDDNEYLTENQLQDQLQMFDVVFCSHLPKEEDLQLYDIVVYKQNDIYVIHRIVDIEEPNEKHPDGRYFMLQGDANKYADEYPVLYEQMRGIYRGVRIPFAGSFVLFMQSPAGWLCILLVLFAMIATPLVEKKMRAVRNARLVAIGVIEEVCEEEDVAEEAGVR